MIFEVERKFAVNSLAEVEQQLRSRGAEYRGSEQETDCYFAHPSRDFAATDEALRIRRTGDRNFVTYKGPKLDRVTKTRHEIDLPLPTGAQAGDDFTELLLALSFRPVSQVTKQRQRWGYSFAGRDVQVLLDDVEGVGPYVELEIMADESQLDDARNTLAALAGELGLSRDERRSYLELKLTREKH